MRLDGQRHKMRTGSVVIAAITSCTNTSNPTVMVAAGLLARNAVARGLETKPWVKTSLAPGSRAVTDYLRAADLMDPLEKLRFHLVGYGCTTCIGNSGPLAEPVAEAIEANDLAAVAVLSGNRNFEGRIHPLARASYLASPPLVVAFALAGRIDIDLTTEPIGTDRDGKPVMLDELWPPADEIASVVLKSVSGEVFSRNYASVFDGDDRWRDLPVPAGDRYAWDPSSTYVARPPFFDGLGDEPVRPGRHRRRAGPGRARRQRHDRPHQPGRLDRPHLAGGGVAGRPRRRAARLQLLRRPPRPPRGDDARHVREHPAAQPADPGCGGQRDRASAVAASG